MKSKQIVALVVAVILFIITGISSVLVNRYAQNSIRDEVVQMLIGEQEIDLPDYGYIAVVDVVGTIEPQEETSIYDEAQSYRHLTTLDYIDRLIRDDYNYGLLLYVDSPGGTVYEAEELADKLKEYQESTGCPVWVYMAHYAASGGYYVSAAADRIYANQNTVTGSIGVIMSGFDLSGLYEKLGIRYFSVTSGENKDSSLLTEEQIEIYQGQVDEVYERFVNCVADGRDMPVDRVKQLADGRTYTAQQALENGLIDEISSYEEMREAMSREVGVDVFYALPEKESYWASLFSKVNNITPKSEAQILKETAEEMESGVLMYYAK
ncbi:MAG: signal peptide peptidase SppA [Hespellia sp.]|jgi:protease-4|nr:signal peptide peptidase SppA [Hespellia sp.]